MRESRVFMPTACACRSAPRCRQAAALAGPAHSHSSSSMLHTSMGEAWEEISVKPQMSLQGGHSAASVPQRGHMHVSLGPRCREGGLQSREDVRLAGMHVATNLKRMVASACSLAGALPPCLRVCATLGVSIWYSSPSLRCRSSCSHSVSSPSLSLACCARRYKAVQGGTVRSVTQGLRA